jgi:hypothetical protein
MPGCPVNGVKLTLERPGEDECQRQQLAELGSPSEAHAKRIALTCELPYSTDSVEKLVFQQSRTCPRKIGLSDCPTRRSRVSTKGAEFFNTIDPTRPFTKQRPGRRPRRPNGHSVEERPPLNPPSLPQSCPRGSP